jgi:integrase
MSAARRNKFERTWVSLLQLVCPNGRLLTNPLATVPKADEAADVRRQRRALTEAELVRLLAVARQRPLLDNATVRRGKDKGKQICQLRPETVARLERLGRERALIYKMLVLTGLRKNELATLTVGQLDLDANPPS